MSSPTIDPRRWWALVVIAIAQFIVIMDTPIIGVALPEIQQALGFDQSDLSWVFNDYVIAFGGLLLLGARLSDLFGARRIFITGSVILAAASLLSGVAWSDSVLLLGIFVFAQRVQRSPLMPLGTFRAPNLSAGNAVMALLGAAWIPMWFFLNLYLQQVLGYGAFEAGAALLPMTTLLMVFMVGVTARVVGRLGFRATIVTGMLLLAVGIAWLSFVRADGSYLVDVLPATLVVATGMSLAYIPAMLAALSGARPEESGLASGIVNTTYQVGSALGLAAMTAIGAANGAAEIGNLASLVDGFRSVFVGAALIAVAGAAIGRAWVGQPRPAIAPSQPATQPEFGD